MTGIQGVWDRQVFRAPKDFSFRVGDQLRLPVEFQQQVKDYWAGKSAEDPFLFDGPLLTGRLTKCAQDGTCIVELHRSTYAHYLFGRENNLPPELRCTSVAGNALLRTSDNYWVVARMGQSSSLRQRIKLPGGAASPSDVRAGTFEPATVMRRELKEELGLDALADGPMHVIVRADNTLINLCFEIDLNLDAKELTRHFELHKSSLPPNQQEVESLHFIAASPDGVMAFARMHGAEVLGYVTELLLVVSGLIEPRDL